MSNMFVQWSIDPPKSRLENAGEPKLKGQGARLSSCSHRRIMSSIFNVRHSKIRRRLQSVLQHEPCQKSIAVGGENNLGLEILLS